MNKSLPDEVSNFKEGTLKGSEYQDALRTSNLNLLKLETKDYKWKIFSRKVFFVFVLSLLIIQNAVVFFLIIRYLDYLYNLQLLFSTIVSGTLAETYFILNHVVKWLFTDIKYQIRKIER